jgi:hypothetical protein
MKTVSPIVSSAVLSEVFADEAVVLDLASGTYYALNASGTFIWNLLERGCSEPEVREALAARYPDKRHELEADLAFFLDRLADKRLVRCRQGPT